MFYFNPLWESLLSVLMDFFRSDLKNHSPKVVLKWEIFFDGFSVLLLSFMQYVYQFKFF